MKRSFWINVLLLFVMALSGYAVGQLFLRRSPPAPILEAPIEAVQPHSPEILPAFKVQAMNGEFLDSEDFKGRILLINFWATWCAPCVIEFPHLIAIASAMPGDVSVLALSSDLGDEPVKTFLAKLEPLPPNFYVALDGDHLTQTLFQTFRLPETLIVDRSGVIVAKLIGADWSLEELREILNKL